ncbi:MAG: hypothetical protein EBR82_43265 [Caulobacteraceae bacterium]|nr:hypothetical protein [Caulobacteraceae bacterium]
MSKPKHRKDDYFYVNKNLLLLLISIVLVVIGFWVAVESSRDCRVIEYQDLQGTHNMTVCKGGDK